MATSVEAEFPDFRTAMEVHADKNVILDRDEFFSCIRQAAVMAGSDARAITLQFLEGSLVMSSAAEGVGDARVEMSVDYAGDEVKISFNPEFFLDFSKVKLPEQLPMSFKDATAAVSFQPAEDFSYVVMPVNP